MTPLGEYPPPKQTGNCQACRQPIRVDQEAVMNLFHKDCLLLVGGWGPNDEAWVYRSPQGMTVRMMKPGHGTAPPKPKAAPASDPFEGLRGKDRVRAGWVPGSRKPSGPA
jgi:hypothetical protein